MRGSGEDDVRWGLIGLATFGSCSLCPQVGLQHYIRQECWELERTAVIVLEGEGS